jgi:flagellar hook protein FlgE
MFNAFTTALGALTAAGTGLNIISNNLANLNTTGYKKEVAQFHDLVAEAFRQCNQGAVQTTDGNLDAAIQGDGYFVVHDYNDRELYTRDGAFRLDAAGTLLTATGQRVQGWSATDGRVDASGAVGDIVLPLGALLPSSVSTRFEIDANLYAGAETGTTFSVPLQVVDSLKQNHNLTVTFTRSAAAGTWSYDITIPGADVGSTDPKVSIATGTDAITFDGNGLLVTPAADVTDVKITDLANGAVDLNLTWNLFAANGGGRLTQYATPSAAAAISTDGSASAQLSGIELAEGGVVVAKYSGSSDRVIARIALASIRNPDSLIDAGSNCLALSSKTATPVIGQPEMGSRGRVVAKALESSTVDIAQEFTNLILMQRGYQANAKVITTSDELTQEVINLKR